MLYVMKYLPLPSSLSPPPSPLLPLPSSLSSPTKVHVTSNPLPLPLPPSPAYPTVFNITQTPATPPNAGTSLTLWCSMQPYLQLTNPSYAITWTKDGAPFYQTLGRVGSYLFSSLTVANNGFYECFATILDSTGLSLVSKLGSMTLTVGGKWGGTFIYLFLVKLSLRV